MLMIEGHGRHEISQQEQYVLRQTASRASSPTSSKLVLNAALKRCVRPSPEDTECAQESTMSTHRDDGPPLHPELQLAAERAW